LRLFKLEYPSQKMFAIWQVKLRKAGQQQAKSLTHQDHLEIQ
jgi:hypothetical protein